MNTILQIAAAMLFSSSALCAEGEVKTSEKSPSVWQVRSKRFSRNISLKITIADFKISCDEKSAIVWGQTTENLGVGAVPYARIYMINLRPLKILNSYTVSRGPYEVRFLCDCRQVLIDEYLVDSMTGRILDTSVTDTASLKFESCNH